MKKKAKKKKVAPKKNAKKKLSYKAAVKKYSPEIKRKLELKRHPFSRNAIKLEATKGDKNRSKIKKGVKPPKIEPYRKGKHLKGTILEANMQIIRQSKERYDIREAARRQDKLISDTAVNNIIKRERKKLIKEQINKGTSGRRVKEIDDILHGRTWYKLPITKAYQKKYNISKDDMNAEFTLQPFDNFLKKQKNELNLFLGKDFYYIVNDSFSKYEIKESELLKRINKGENIAAMLVENYRKRVSDALDASRIEYQRDRKKMAPLKRKKLVHRIDALEKILNKANMNEEAVDKLSEKPLMKLKGQGKDYNLKQGGSYPMFLDIVGVEILID